MEIFLFDPATRAFTQITDSTEPFFNFEPSLSASGNRIAFTSTADLTGNNGDHSREIFLFDTSSNSLIQITIAAVLRSCCAAATLALSLE